MTTDNINRDYVKDVFGEIMKVKEMDPVMYEKMSMAGALFPVTNEEAEAFERNRERVS